MTMPDPATLSATDAADDADNNAAEAAANAEQRAASNPAVSAFVAASAGSGKTKLLTDRLLRLMLAGTPPEKILCLTFTKAAAAEMAIRLNRRLGEWVVLAEPVLDARLRALDVPPGPAIRARARQLFADVLDLPGGMKIGTIHAFCQSLLRRFPLEAGLSPHFELADDNEAGTRLREARETIAADPAQRDAIMALAADTDESGFAHATDIYCLFQDQLSGLLREFKPDGVAAMQRAALGAGDAGHEQVLRAAVRWEREAQMGHAWRRIAEAGNPSGQKIATDNLTWLAHEAEDRVLNWIKWVEGHFTKSGTPAVLNGYYGKKLAAERADLHREIETEQTRIEQIEDARKAAKLAGLNQQLLHLVIPILAANQAEKNAAARLSYGDLVTHTGALLKDPGAAWVLYKLDGGIEHLLLDEVQDTAPAQWRIAEQIAAEFFAGSGARAATGQPARSVFAVGDAKQSIFSFQGADLQSFEHHRAKFRERVRGAGQKWLDGALSVSFRSTAPVLALVDAVFAAGPARAGVVAADATLTHGVSRQGQAGAVTLWPPTQPNPPPDLPPWQPPGDYQLAAAATAILARAIAAHIENLLAAPAILPSRQRAIRPGDILILVRRRDALVTAITSECKQRNIPIAGVDRMELTSQQAVSDLLALCDALLLPEDDLAFGQFLASPLGGLSDESLRRLASRRRHSLAATLQARRAEQPDWRQAHALFSTLRNRVDYITPHALLAEILGPHGGRARLLRRLGPEAAEPIDELLTEAQNYARREPGSLQNFIHELRLAKAVIKRETEAGDVVRIMTVHGAKGLQAPIVILPDTTALPPRRETVFWLHPPQQQAVTVPVYCPRAALRPAAVTQAANAGRAADLEEYNRLLYVALTRAEDELIICGAASRAIPAESWYAAVQAGFERLEIPADGQGIRTRATPQTAAADRAASHAPAQPVALPGWAGVAPGWAAAPPAAETTRPEPLAPSRGTDDDAKRAIAASPLGGALADARLARAAALAKGRAVHALLQHLPALPPPRRATATAAYLAKTLPGQAPAMIAATAAAVLQILDDPALAPLFGPHSRAEVPLAGVIGAVEIGGLVDRLAILPGQILLADYKTDRVPPATADAIPAAYLRQLAAYRAVLGQIHPDRPVTCLLIFTQTAAVLPVPAALLAGHAPAGPQPYPAPAPA